MATSCTSTATGTRTTVITTESLSTSLRESITTLPATTTTITSATTTCLGGSLGLSSVACLSATTTLTSTILGETSTVTVPVVETIPATQTSTLTLFGTVCTTLAPVGGSAVSISTPDPTIITSASPSTLPNGSITVLSTTFTSTLPGTAVYVPTPGSDQSAQKNTDGANSPKIGPIVGGVVAGFFGLLGAALLVWFILKRRRRWDDIFDREFEERPPKRFSLDGGDESGREPKPYHYGLVGKTPSPSPHTPSPPPHQQRHQYPNHNLAPLTVPMTVSQPGLSAGTTTSTSRPSTAGSMRPLRDPLPPRTPSAQSQSHHHATSSGSSTGVGIHPSVALPPSPCEWGHHAPSPSTDAIHMESGLPVRVGSPTSLRELGGLRVANWDGEVGTPPTPAAMSPLTQASATRRQSSGPGPAMLDGKGRNVRLGSGGPGVLQHTDGGPVPPGWTGAP